MGNVDSHFGVAPVTEREPEEETTEREPVLYPDLADYYWGF